MRRADHRLAAGAGQADIGEASLLLQPGLAVLLEGAVVGKQAVLPAGQKDQIELQPLGAVQGHDADLVLAAALIGLHHQRHMLQEPLQGLEIGHGVDQFLEVVEPARRLGGLVLLPHPGIAGFVEHHAREIGVGAALCQFPPALKILQQGAQGLAQLGFQLVGAGERPGGLGHRQALGAAELVDLGQRRRANAALGQIDDALEGQIVGRLSDHPEIGHGVADFLALIKARAADHPVGQAEGHETLFELAGLGAGPNQHRHLV